MTAASVVDEGALVQAAPQPILPRKPPQRRLRMVQAALVLVPLALAVWIAAAQVLIPPPVVPARAPATEFSADRAMAYLPNIAGEPHAVGSPAQARVRDYLLEQIRALGLEPVTQEATGAVSSRTGVYAANVQNILVRVPGTSSTGAVALMAHYDSQPNTPGASDDGSAVAALLETMRAVQAGPALRNDAIFVLTDAEEADAVGAEAFFWQHPWARDVSVVVNFEAAGDTGASVLLDTSPGNLRLVEGFAQAVPHPLVTSYLTQLNSVMPFGTDMTVFVENGVAGVSPMYGWHYRTLYHSVLDNTGVLDRRSVQQQGENVLGLARYFGSLDLGQLDRSQDAVAFTFAPGLLVIYSARLAVPLAALACLLAFGAIAIGVRRRALSVGGSLAGVGLALTAVLVALVFSALVWVGISRTHPEYWRNIMGAPYAADVYLVAFVALVLAAGTGTLLLAGRWVSQQNLLAGAVLVWSVLALLSATTLPGISYVFMWPAVIAEVVLAGQILRPATAGWARSAALGVAAGASIMIVLPVTLWTYLIVGFWLTTMQPDLPLITVSLLFVALLLTLLVPELNLLRARWKWVVPGLGAVLAIGFLSAGSLMSAFGPTQPLPNGVWYELDADNGQATWYSYGGQPDDAWTAQFFSGPLQPVDLVDVYAATPGNPAPSAAFSGPAPIAALAPPDLVVLSDQTVGDLRQIQLHLSSPRQARGLRVELAGASVLSARINGVLQTNSAWPDRDRWFLRYYGMTAGGTDLSLDIPATARSLTLRITDQSDGLPALDGVTYQPRSAGMTPFQIAQEYMPYPETTSVTRTFRLD